MHMHFTVEGRVGREKLKEVSRIRMYKLDMRYKLKFNQETS